MKFVASLTVDASLLKKLLKLWEESGEKRNPFRQILVTPLFASSATLQIIKGYFKEEMGSEIYFDSGGYYVQQGKLSFEKLCSKLQDCYMSHTWADWYVLPDHVPTSKDTLEIVRWKVMDTFTGAKMLYHELPSSLKEKTLAVLHGHSAEQILKSFEQFLALGIHYFGFGSFGTLGKSQDINLLTTHSLRLISFTSSIIKSPNRLHIFGVSTPPAVYIFHSLGAYSFDSLAWLRSAGHGKVFMPFVRAYNVCYRSIHNSSLTEDEFRELQELTGHTCQFCKSFENLRKDRLYRALHNLLVLYDMAYHSDKIPQERVSTLLKKRSSRYAKLLEGINEQRVPISYP